MRLVVLYDAKVDALFDCLLRCNKDMHFLMLFERKRAQFWIWKVIFEFLSMIMLDAFFCKSFIVWNFLNCIINIYSADRSKYGNITVSDTFLFNVLSFCFHDTLFSNSIIINTFLPKLRSSTRKIKTQFLNPKFSLYLSRFRSMTNKKFFGDFAMHLI